MWSNAFIAGFLGLQLLVPLAYYARGGGSDERFAWRMFSSQGMRRCEVRVDELVDHGGSVEQRAVDLSSQLSRIWITLLEGDRPQIAAKFLRRRCESGHAREVVYRSTCVDGGGQALPPRELAWDCARGEPRGRNGGA